jgi:hypothetical protein
MGVVHKVRTGVFAAFIGIAGMVVPAGQAAAQSTSAVDVQAAASCDITRWGHTGKYLCGAGHVENVDWDWNGSTDETFVIAPNRQIWHIWATANGWEEMPGNGRADLFSALAGDGTWHCVAVYAGNTEWDNRFNGSGWSGWARGGC